MNLSEKLLDTLHRLDASLERRDAGMQAALSETQNAIRLRGARAVPAGDVGRPLLWAGPGRLVGWSLTAVGGPAVVTLRDGRDTTGDPIASIAIDQDGTAQLWAGPGGVSFGEGLYADVNGNVTGAVWLGAVD